MACKERRTASPGTLWLGVILGGVLWCVGCSPASVAFREGRKAEEQKNYDSAVIDFHKALRYQPANTLYAYYEKEARNNASIFHARQGAQLLAQGRPDEAVGEFQKAISIDPSNQVAGQYLQRILLGRQAAQQQRQQAIRAAMEKAASTETEAGIELEPPLPSTPIARLHLSANSRTVFQTLGKLAGVNVIFHYDFQPKPVSLDLSNVTILQALQAAADEADVFWQPVNHNTILVIPDTPSNRRELEEDVLKTVYLQNPVSAADRTAILTSLKQILGIQKVYENPQTNSITLFDVPERVNQAVALIHSLDRGKAEVLISVTLLEADRNRIRDLGLAPTPLDQNGTMAAVGLNTTPSTTAGGASATTLGLNQLGRLSTGNFSIALPYVTAEALLSDNRTHILQNPQVRVTAGETARLRIGQQVPIATGSFGIPTATTSTAAGAFGLLANTQFQYKDVGVNLEITPEVAADGDIIMHTKVNISALGPTQNIGGIAEPTFTQRSIEQDIRLKEGEVSLLGGLNQTQTTRTVTGLPGLSRLPVLRYLFSTENYTVTDEEVLIMLTPHLVRLPDAGLAALHANAQPDIKGADPPGK